MESARPEVAYDCRDRVATITLDRPDHGNAMTLRLCAELVDALDRADADDDVAAVVLTGLLVHRGRHRHHAARPDDPRAGGPCPPAAATA
jgi:1,4-dihydroxy-2-naphthoyl-CoA synthase